MIRPSDTEPARRFTRRFEDKVALITGGGHGIGRATAERLGSEGARVVVVDVDGDAARHTAQALTRNGAECLALVADVSNPEAVDQLTAETLHRFGRIDILHNNAGRLRPGSVVDVAIDEWDRTFAINIRAMFLVCRAIVPLMRNQGGGTIVNTASVSGLIGEPNTPAYNASKAAVINFTRQLAADFTRDGIRVNCVCPGWIPTGFNDPVLVDMEEVAVQQTVERTVPLGRQGAPEEVAAAVAFLASDDASYIVGEALVVDGGLLACG